MEPEPDPREQPVEYDVKASVRAERIKDLETQYSEGRFGVFDWLILKWFEADPELYKHLSLPAHAEAVAVLYDEGLL